MFRSMLRTAFLMLLAVLVAGPLDAFARGPGGGGGRGAKGGGARAGGGPGGNSNALAGQDRKKKKSGPKSAGGGPKFGAVEGNNNGPGQAFGGKVGNAQNLGGVTQKFPGGLGNSETLRNGPFGADKFQPLQQQAGQKFQNRDGQIQQNLQTRNGENAQNARNNFQNGPQPFTAEWYADHPAAWQTTHPHADAWAAATATGVAAWLGWAAYGNNDTSGYGTTYYNNYVYEEVPADDSEEAAEEPVADERITDDAAADDATTAQNDNGEWLALGVYSVLLNSGESTSRMLQLSVNRQGEIRGVYYDSISNTSQNLSGYFDQKTQLAQWSLDSNPQITFRAGLDALTESTGTIEVDQPGGDAQWHIARQTDAG